MNVRVEILAALLLVSVLVVASALSSGCGTAQSPEANVHRFVIDSSEATVPTTDVQEEGGIVYFSWFGTNEDGLPAVYVSSLAAVDSTPSRPVRVNPAGVTVNPHPQAPAQIAAGRGKDVFVAWSTRKDVPGRRFPASNVVLARSGDGGRTFDPPVFVNDDADGPPAGHTFHDLTVGPDGTIYVAWLDSRNGDHASEAVPFDLSHGSGAHDPSHGGGAAGLLHRGGAADLSHGSGAHDRAEAGRHLHGALSESDVRIARSTDGGRTFSESVVVARGSCQCCRTAVFVGDDDSTVYLAWRHIYEDNVRDIAFATSGDGARTFSEPVRVHTDGWRIEGCPHSGPSLAVDAEGTIHVSWYTAGGSTAGLRYATSSDGGRHFTMPELLESGGPLAHSQLTAGSGIPVWVAWEDPLANQVRAAPAGEAPSSSERKLTFAGAMPSIAAAGSVRSVVWQNGGAVEAFVERNVED